MVFAGLSFLCLFLPATLLAYYAWPGRTWRNVLLLAVSLLFYAWGEPVYVLLMMLSILLNWAVACAMDRWRRKARAVLVAGVTLNLLGIAVFKYAGFLAASVSALLHTRWAAPGLVLPIGISFYTFQAISYLVDVYRGTVTAQRNPLYFGAYLTMFPQLIAGPIVRYETIEQELRDRRESVEQFASGIRRFIAGLAKKVLIANSAGAVADTLIGAGPGAGALPAWCGLFAYSLQIYFDFSGYSDMAIGLGRMFGFHFLENFDHPYIARSVSEFWRRWHISLSTFFRDYVYIPLGGNRVSAGRWVLNLMLVWGLTGLWHGASWTFVCWGLYYGLLLAAEKLVWGRAVARLPAALQHAYAILAILIGWVIFRAESFGQMGGWLAALFGAHGAGHVLTLNALNVLHLCVWMPLGAVLATPLARYGAGRMAAAGRGALLGWVQDACVVFLLAWCLLSLAMGGFNPFIYFRF